MQLLPAADAQASSSHNYRILLAIPVANEIIWKLIFNYGDIKVYGLIVSIVVRRLKLNNKQRSAESELEILMLENQDCDNTSVDKQVSGNKSEFFISGKVRQHHEFSNMQESGLRARFRMEKSKGDSIYPHESPAKSGS